ncbi:MAG: hypothetical protein GF341_05215 [candidate division Zixibacteria bacterium]|nr:hypothetical protein [candidate division Zixibacteria bacterium]
MADIALNPNGNRLFCAVLVTHCFNEEFGGAIVVLDPRDLSLIEEYEGFQYPYQLEIGPPLPP